MLTRRFRDVRNFARSSSSRLLLAMYLLCWLPSMLDAFSDYVPVVTITNASQEILVAENSKEILQFTCNGNDDLSSNLTWARDDNFVLSQDKPGISLISNDSLTLVLTINVSEADSGSLASKEGVPYYCLARNNLGTARSQAVTLQYPSFEGFNKTMENETVEVRTGPEQAVALHCGYVGTPVPKPEVTWLKDQEPIPIDSAATNPKYRVLEKGELVIYRLTMSDIMNGNSEPVQYRCRVDNVLIVESQIAPFFYTLHLNESNTLSEDPTVYLNPPASIFLMKSESAFFYFIYASNFDNLELVATQTGFPNDITENDANLRVSLEAVQGNVTITFHASYIDGSLQGYDPPVTRDTVVTVIEPLVIDATTTMNQVFRGFTSETTFNFTCKASGTQLELVWYRDGVKISANGPSLTIPKALPNDSGVYQCFWTSELRPCQIFDSVSWALVVRDRVSPNVISITTSEPLDNMGRVIVVEGTTVIINVTVRSDVVPEISWIFANLNGMSEPLDPSNMTLYKTTSVTLIGEELYQFSLTLVKMTAENSGWYSPVIDDGFTGEVVGDMQFISVEFPAELVSVVSSHMCLLVGEVVTITCVVEGLPEPTVSFIKNSEAFQIGDCQSCNISGNVLTFSTVTRNDEGSYGCTAQNTVKGEIVEDSRSLNGGMVFFYCDHPEVSVVGPSSVTATEGEEVTFTCRVTSAPEPVVTWLFNGAIVDIRSDNYTTTQTTDGDYSLTIRSVTTSNTGTYTCQVNNTAIPEVVIEDIDLSVNHASNWLTDWQIAIVVSAAIFSLVIGVALLLAVSFCTHMSAFRRSVRRHKEQTSCDVLVDPNPAYGFHQVGVQQDGNKTLQAHESHAVVEITSKEKAVL